MIEVLNKEDIVPPPKDEEELELEKLVFGDLEGFGGGLKNIEDLYNESEDEIPTTDEEDSEEELDDVEDDQLFFVDDGEQAGDRMDVDNNEEDEEDEEESQDSDAWFDSEDEDVSISLLQSDKLKKLRKTENDDLISGKRYVARLRAQFEKIYPRPKWADQEPSEDDDSDEEMLEDEEAVDTVENGDIRALSKILQSNKSLLNTKPTRLLPHSKIDITRLKDANQKALSKSAIQTLSFHPTHPLMLTSGYDRTIRVYNIDGINNTVVSTIHLRDSSIQTAQFNSNSQINKIFAGGRRRYMYSWDLTTGAVDKISRMYGHEETQRSFENFKLSPNGEYIGLQGNNGWINILSCSTAQWVHGFKIEGTIVDFDWGQNDGFIIAVNSVGDVWEFSMGTKKVIKRWRDETGVGITKIKIGGKNDKWCAIGSASGIVNIYDRNNTKKPANTLDQLVTTISTLEFNHDGQILCIASRAKKDALRLVHLPSCTVFQNWPTSGTPMGRVTAVKFSPNSEMICIANEAGKARLWRLNQY